MCWSHVDRHKQLSDVIIWPQNMCCQMSPHTQQPLTVSRTSSRVHLQHLQQSVARHRAQHDLAVPCHAQPQPCHGPAATTSCVRCQRISKRRQGSSSRRRRAAGHGQTAKYRSVSDDVAGARDRVLGVRVKKDTNTKRCRHFQ